jgi:hypothetical protein
VAVFILWRVNNAQGEEDENDSKSGFVRGCISTIIDGS